LNKTNLTSIIIFIFLATTVSLHGQVKGLSYTLSPSVEYNFFNDESGIADGTLAGAQLGLGFGQLIELRALYFKDVNLTTDINRFGVDVGQGVDTSFMGNPIDLERYGAEIKLNLGTNALSPFVVAGTGIQSISINGQDANKQIYLSGGLGLQLSVADRFTMTLQGLRNSYRSNAVQQLLGDDELDVLGLDPADFNDTDYSSWAGRASLLIYIGGRRPGTYSDTDRAYMNKFKRGFSLAIEPTVNRTNFNESLPYRDAYFGGAFVGFDFGPMIGIRGFYMRALQDGSRTKFDDLALIGGEARFRLGDNQGLTPFFTLGGGQIRPGDDYEGEGGGTLTTQAFASGGAGINLSLGRFANLTAYGRSILTSNKNVTEISSVDAITNSWSYGLSLNLLVGGASDEESDDFTKYNDRNDELRDMNNEIDKLDRELNKAIRNQDKEKVLSVSREREIALQRLSLVEKTDGNNKSLDKDEKKEIEQEERKVNKKIRMIKDMSDEEFIEMMNERDSYGDRSYQNSNLDNDEEIDVQGEVNKILRERDAQDRNKRAEEEIRQLREELDELYDSRDNKSNSRDSNAEMQNQMDELRQELKEMRDQDKENRERTLREEKNSAYAKELDELRKEIREMRDAEKRSYRDSNTDSINAIEELRREIKELREGGRNDRTRRDNSNESSAEIEELRNELKSLREGGSDKNSRNQKKTNSEREIEELRKEIKSLRGDGENSNKSDDSSTESERMIKELRLEIEEMKEERSGKSNNQKSNDNQSAVNDIKAEIKTLIDDLDELDDDNSKEAKQLKKKVDDLNKELKRLQTGIADVDYDDNEDEFYEDPNSPRVRSAFKSNEEATGFFNKLRYNGASGIAGFNFGSNASLNVGYRMHYIIDGKKNLEFMPETYFGFGSPTNFGILANVNYHVRGAVQSKKGLRPYVGAGAGIIKTGSNEDSDKVRPVINLLVGTALDLLNGKLYVDFSTRNFLKYNQIVAGYKFPF